MSSPERVANNDHDVQASRQSTYSVFNPQMTGTKTSMFTVEQTQINYRRQKNRVRNYIRSGVIDENFSVSLEFIRDPENVLNILKHIDEPSNTEYRDITMKLRNKYNPNVQDTYYNIMQQNERLSNRLTKQNQVDMRNKTPSEHSIYIVVEISDGV